MSKPSLHERVSTRISASSPSLSHPCPVPSSGSSLDGVPDLYIISQLHRFAGNYWNKPETADCTVVVPKSTFLESDDDPRPAQAMPPGRIESGSSNDGRHRRLTQQMVPQKMAFKLHQQYLSIQSTLLRSVLDDWQSGNTSFTPPKQVHNGGQTRSQSGPLRSPSLHLSVSNRAATSARIPHILPSSRPNHPIIYLPVPDPVSIPHLFYYLYFGTFGHIEDSLQKGALTWQSIVRNVEYLGMRVEIKAALGRYHRIWMKPTSTPPPQPSEQEAEDDSSTSGESGDGCHSDTERPSGKNEKKV